MFNHQKYRNIEAPGWRLGWTWAKKEIIWQMMGAQTTEQGDCSRFKGNIPHCCKSNPEVVDLLPGTPYNQQFANCCRGGVLRANTVSSFQISVGQAGTSNRTVKLPRDFTFKAPGPGYTCGPAKIVRPTQFITADKHRTFKALMTWKVVCVGRSKE
ncbi:hypothetical protein SOVF_049220 isoform A [Spinacia oleracea]|nr:hypothetical protein SOVF_049220 isoform A [Spinacia oleracea]